MSKMSVDELPVPECEGGYTNRQLIAIMGDDLHRFNKWMYGQTKMLCEGRRYNPSSKSYDQACGGVSHGPVCYPGDVKRFLEDKPIIDW